MTGVRANGDTDPSGRPLDSLDLLSAVSNNMRELFATWDDKDPHDRADPGDTVNAARQRGTVGKELVEQAALRLAAVDDVARVLRASGQPGLADRLDGHSPAARTITARLTELSRGVGALDLRYSHEFADLVDQLRTLWADELDGYATRPERMAAALGERRRLLRDSTFIRGHAPNHPSAHHRWYQSIPLVVRIHAIYDRFRAFPNAESTPWSDVTMIDRYDPGR